jgi:Bacterial DNA-binding protein
VIDDLHFAEESIMAPRKPRSPDTKPAKASKAASPLGAAKPEAPVRPMAEAADAAKAPGSSRKTKPALTVAEDAAAGSKPGMMRMKELVDAVAEATGGKKPDVKKTIEAALSTIGAALATGSALAIPPLGKLRVVKNKGPALTLKLRLADGPKAAGLALAEDGEDS